MGFTPANPPVIRPTSRGGGGEGEIAAGGISGFVSPRRLCFNRKGEGFTAAAEIGSLRTFIIEYNTI